VLNNVCSNRFSRFFKRTIYFSGMWQQQQQQFFSPSFGGFSTCPDTQQPKTIRPLLCKTKTDIDYHLLLPSDCMIQQSSSNHLYQRQKQCVCSLSSQNEKFNNTTYDQSPIQQQYASYPPGAIYRRTSGPGWQQQQVSYPSR